MNQFRKSCIGLLERYRYLSTYQLIDDGDCPCRHPGRSLGLRSYLFIGIVEVNSDINQQLPTDN
jgi:hypothetical protein